MNGVLIFFIAIAAIVAGAKLFNKIKGNKAQYIDTFEIEANEIIMFKDEKADFYLITKYGRAAIMSFARMQRTFAIKTNKRLIIGQKVLFSKRHMITHMIYFNFSDDLSDEVQKLSGGLYSKGFQVMKVDQSQSLVLMDGVKKYIKMVPIATLSSTNIEHIRLYSNNATEFLN